MERMATFALASRQALVLLVKPKRVLAPVNANADVHPYMPATGVKVSTEVQRGARMHRIVTDAHLSR